VLKGIPGGLKQPSRGQREAINISRLSVFASSLRKVNILNACFKEYCKEPHRSDFLI
jgi:hypothetical protein